MFRSAAFVVVLGFFFLKPSGVREQHLDEVSGRPGRVDISREPILEQTGEIAAMVDVSVGEDYPLNRRRRHGKAVPIAESKLLEPLVESAINEEPPSLGLHEKLRSRDCPRATEELDGDQSYEKLALIALVWGQLLIISPYCVLGRGQSQRTHQVHSGWLNY